MLMIMGLRVWFSRLGLRSERFFLSILMILAAFFAVKAVSDLDIWWHLAAGRYISENRSFITTDPFSFTFAGEKWVSIPWFYEWLIFKLYGWGFGAVQAFHALLALGTVFYLWKSCLKLSVFLRKSVGGLVLLFWLFVSAIAIAEIRWIGRPEQVTHFLGAVFLYCLVSYKRSLNKKYLYPLPVLQIFWVNMHGLFLFGPIFVAFFLAKSLAEKASWKQCKTLVVVFGATVLVCLVNPRGLQGSLFPFHLLKVLTHDFYQRTIPEATNALLDGTWAFDAWGLLFWAFLCAANFALLSHHFLKRSKKENSNAVFFSLMALAVFALFYGALFWSALSARRNIPLFVLWTLPFVSRVPNVKGRARLVLAVGAVVFFTTLLAGFKIPSLQFHTYGKTGEAVGVHSMGAQEFLARNPFLIRELKAFSNVEFANYTLFKTPGFRSYIDSRFAELYSYEHFRRYMDVLAHPPLLEEEVSRLGITWVALNLNLDLAKSFAAQLAENRQWKRVYVDETSVIFMRSEEWSKWKISEITEAQVLERIRGEKNVSDRALLLVQFAESLSIVQSRELSLHTIEEAMKLDPWSEKGWVGYCRISYMTESAPRTQTESICRDAMKQVSSKGKTPLHHILGILALDRKEYSKAEEHFREVIARDSASFEAWWMLSVTLFQWASDSQGQLLERDLKVRALKAIQETGRLRPYDERVRKLREEFLRFSGVDF